MACLSPGPRKPWGRGLKEGLEARTAWGARTQGRPRGEGSRKARGRGFKEGLGARLGSVGFFGGAV